MRIIDFNIILKTLRQVRAFNNETDPSNESLDVMIEALQEGRVQIVGRVS